MSAKVICDSISREGHRLTTLELRYWRGIHSELMTHRVFSRNARSSRAVPVSKLIGEVEVEPFIPQHWGANQKGMQAGGECNEPLTIFGPQGHPTHLSLNREEAWLVARDRAVEVAQAFTTAGYHKQIVNRLLEPFMYIDTLVTATEWSNFFALRNHKDAEPHFQDLAREMHEAMAASEPTICAPTAWHLPYVDINKEAAEVAEWLDSNDGWAIYQTLIKLSVARCARISYTPFDGDGKIESELKRYNLLVGSHPMHASPAEHQATPDEIQHMRTFDRWRHPKEHGNFVGWRQYRKMLPGESQ
jgi:hypothetical protein